MLIVLSNDSFLEQNIPKKYVVSLNFMGSELLQMDGRELEGNVLDNMGALILGGVDRDPNEFLRLGEDFVQWAQISGGGYTGWVHLAYLGRFYNEDIPVRILTYPKALVNLLTL